MDVEEKTKEKDNGKTKVHSGLARRYRPRKFHEIIEQMPAVQALQNALKKKQLSSAYLFFGPRGVGKTTLARLIARSINCETPKDEEACGVCASCQSIEGGQSMDVMEIDAASHRGIDYIRELRENVKFRPMNSHKKVYIIDEVHMLTMESFNALLKTLEEPPDHAIFILATTESHKVPQTILSRCQIFNLSKLPIQKLQDHLGYICKEEKVSYEDEALFWIARMGDGSVRDSISFLEQSIHYCGKHLKTSEVKELCGQTPLELFIQITKALLANTQNTNKQSNDDNSKLLAPIQEFFNKGMDLQRFVWEYLDFLRLVIHTQKGIRDTNFLGLPESSIKILHEELGNYGIVALQHIFEEIFSLLNSFSSIGLRNSYEARILVEMKLLSIKESLGRPSLSGILQKLNQFSAALATGSAESSSYSLEHELQKQFLGTVVDTDKTVKLD